MGKKVIQSLDNDLKGYGNIKGEYDGLSSQLADSAQQLGTQLIDINRAKLYRYLADIDTHNGTVVFIGDSVTAGNVNGGHGWFEYLSSYFPNINYVNKGVGGNTTLDVINRMTDILSSPADLYVLAIGTNDVRYADATKGAITPSAFVTNIDTIVSQLTKPVVIIEPWPAFNADYTSALGYATRDMTMKDFSGAEEQYCSQKNIPFIKVIDDIKSAVDFANKYRLYVDYIHPTSPLGVQFYSEEVLFGKRSGQNYGVLKSATSSSVKYVYKLVIYKAFNQASQLDLKTLTTNRSTVGTVWTTCANNGADDTAQLFNSLNSTYHFQNKTNDFPIIIAFGATDPIYYLKQDWFTAGIGKYALYECSEITPNFYSPILDFDHKAWRLIAKDDFGIGTSANSAPKRYLFNLFRTPSSVSYQSGWSVNSTSIHNLKTMNGFGWMNLNLVKSSNIVSGETICTLPDEMIPLTRQLIPCILYDGTTSTSELSFVYINTDGTIQMSDKFSASNRTKVNVNGVYPIL